VEPPNALGVSRPPPPRSPTVKTDAQLWQLGGSAARRVGWRNKALILLNKLARLYETAHND